jgi:hypothetical protein
MVVLKMLDVCSCLYLRISCRFYDFPSDFLFLKYKIACRPMPFLGQKGTEIAFVSCCVTVNTLDKVRGF